LPDKGLVEFRWSVWMREKSMASSHNSRLVLLLLLRRIGGIQDVMHDTQPLGDSQSSQSQHERDDDDDDGRPGGPPCRPVQLLHHHHCHPGSSKWYPSSESSSGADAYRSQPMALKGRLYLSGNPVQPTRRVRRNRLLTLEQRSIALWTFFIESKLYRRAPPPMPASQGMYAPLHTPRISVGHRLPGFQNPNPDHRNAKLLHAAKKRKRCACWL